MSVNITVNGKFGKHYQKRPLLLNLEEAEKEQEAERRKLRLLQVREQSKKFAENVRKNVKEAKRKELERIEAAKAAEYNAWRQQAIQQQRKDNREAVFQIGAAYRAAEAENKKQAEKAEKQGKQEGTYKEFKKQMAARRRNKENFASEGPCLCSKVHICPNTKFQCACYKAGKNVEETQKRKRELCSSSSETETESEDETNCEETLKETSTSCSVSPTKSFTTISSSKNRATQTSLICSEKNLRKTPAVFLDVEVGSEDSVVITGPVEVKDKHAEYNRQFSSVIRVSPRKARNTQEDKADKKQTQVTCTSTATSADSRSKEMDENTIEQRPPVAKAVREKRFTLISDLVKKQQEQPLHPPQVSPKKRPAAEVNINVSPQKSKATTSFIPARAPVSRPMSQPVTPSVSPRKGSVSSKSSKVISGGHTQPQSFSAASLNTVAMGSTSSSSCRVQFYDYNSKLAKDGVHNNTRVNRQKESVQPTAMEHAAMENRIQFDRQEDLVAKNKQMEERGQKALEREQVRRDCNDLTEKLDALTRQYPRQVPNNDNAPHIFVDKQLRKEHKMNSAVERLLNRPNIITCSEIDNKETKPDENKPERTKSTNYMSNEINVGATINKNSPVDDVSSDSCCSILLGYVDDQSRQVRKDLEQWPEQANSQKQHRLRNLLQRLDHLRNSLMLELRNATDEKVVNKKKSTDKDEHYLQFIDDIAKYRQERENIMISDILKPQKNKEKEKEKRPLKKTPEERPEQISNKNKMQQEKQLPLDEREKILQQKETILEEKLREFYELQKQQKKKEKSNRKESSSDEQVTAKELEEEELSEDKENINCTPLETPVEIVITVQGESKCIKIPGKSKRKVVPKRSSTQLATLIRSPQPKRITKKCTPKKKTPINTENPAKAPIGRQNSYDSNSTSYMSLPPHLVTQLGVLLDKTQQQSHNVSSGAENTETSTEFDCDGGGNVRPVKNPVPHLNPLVAQYVQRLLGMSRNAIQRLGVSSSDIDTPSSTLINISDNNATSDSTISEERLACVESFVQENRSFIKELEQSLRAQKDTSLENSMRTFDAIWRKRLKQQSKDTKTEERKSKHKNQTRQPLKEEENQSTAHNSRKTKATSTKVESQSKELQSKEITSQTKLSLNTNRPGDLNKLNSHVKHSRSHPEQFESSPKFVKPQPRQRRPTNQADKAVETKMAPESNKTESDAQIARYAKLTENCTHRIAELTELINRVRQEKQRLLEVTLSSVSDNGRQSTEYLELPDGKSRTTNEAESSLASSTEDVAQIKPTSSVDMTRQMPKLSSLEKNRPITASQDSGIAESRPITAQENRTDLEPISQTSTESQSTIQPRKLKPPPTLRRFSPQFQEDELAHELSTILEVDTPANSRINTAVGASTEDRPAATIDSPRNPIMFPTFEEYVEKLNLDITQLDAERSMQLREEFSQFIEDMHNSQTKKKNTQYKEFPSISVYMNHSKSQLDEQTVAMEDSLSQLRLNDLKPNRFPAVREYVQRNTKPTTSPATDGDQQLLDTESLENITDVATNTNTENESASLDIEKELKNRKILKNSFRYTNQSKQIFSSTAYQDGGEFYNEIMAGESGVEKLSTSDNTMAILDTDLKRMVYQWSADKKQKNLQQQYQALSSTTTSTYQSKQEKQGKSTSLDQSSNELGRPLNLRDFLTRELLKHANFSTSTSTTTSSSDDSLRSQFLHSLIGTLTPRTIAATSKSGQHTLDRQKTSTPVPTQSSQAHSTPTSNPSNTSSSQLFSGESRISSVHCNDRSAPRLQTSDGMNADQSSE